MLTPALAEQRREPAYKAREARAKKRQTRRAERAKAASKEGKSEAPAYLGRSGAAVMEMEPLYVTASPQSDLARPGDERRTELGRTPPTATYSPMSTGPLYSSRGAHQTYTAGGAYARIGAPLLPAAPKAPPPSRQLHAGGGKTSPPKPGAAAKPVVKEEESAVASKKKGLAADAPPETETEGDGTAKGADRTSSSRAAGNTVLEKTEPPPPPPVIARTPQTGDHHIERPSFRASIAESGFNVSRDLQTRPSAAQDGNADAKPAAPTVDYRSVYASAVESGFGLYRRLMDEAKRVVADAERRDRQLADLHQQRFNDSLGMLGGALIDSRNRLDAATAQLHLDVSVAADRLRTRIWGAAEGALARLAERLALYREKMSGPEAKAEQVKSDATSGQASLVKAAADASGELDKFAGNVDAGIPQTGSINPVGIATRDAKVSFAPGHIELAKTFIEKMKVDFDKYLTESFKCLPCELDRAFQSIRQQVHGLEVLGPKAVRGARDGALKSVDDAVKQLDEAIDASHDSTDQALIAQHDRAREAMIAIAQTNAEREAEGVESAASRQSQALASMAAAQPKALAQVGRMIEMQANTTPAQFGQFVIRSASRLQENLKGIGERQPRSTSEAAARLGAIQIGRAHQFLTQQRRVIAGTRDGLFDVVNLSAEALGKQIFDTMVSMDEVPGKVAASCNAYLAPAGKALAAAVQNLTDAVEGAAAMVKQTMDGGNAVSDHAKKVKERKDKEAKEQASDKSQDGKKGDKPQGKGEEGKPMPAPASCGECDAEAAKKKEKEDKLPPTPADPAAAKGEGASAGASKDGKGAEGKSEGPEQGSAETPNGFKDLCEKIKGDPKQAPQVKAFLKKADEEVPKGLAKRVETIQTAVRTTFSPHVGLLFSALRGLSAHQGDAIRYLYNKNNWPNLDEKIRRKFLEDSVLSAGSTDRANYRAAINLLNGNNTEGAMQELVAAFNYSNEDQRIRDILLSLTPAQLDALEKAHGKELDELEEQLDGEDLKAFQELRRKNTGPAKALALRERIDSVNDKQEGDKRGDQIAETLSAASTNFRDALEGDKKRKEPDLFGLEAPTDEVVERNKGHWENTKRAFGELESVKSELGKDSDPSQAMFNYATRKVRHTHQEPDPYGEGSITVVTYDEVNPYHKAWIGAIIDKGAESVEAKGARVLVEERRAKTDLKGLDAAMHSGAGDARAGGGYDEKAAKAGAKEAAEERKKILLASEKARVAIEGGKAEENPAVIQKRIAEKFSKKLEGEPNAKEVALGIIASDEGNPLAVIEHAIEKKKTDLALIQLRRMNARQIETLVAKYNEKYPNGPSIYQRLGIFKSYGDDDAAFEGDEANELEIAFMAVPQNDKERAEVALRVMKQTMDQAGRLGKSVCAQEWKALVDNAAALKETIGVTDADIDDFGRIRTKDAQGNPVTVGKFDAHGNFKVAFGGDVTPFETAIAMSTVTASSYKAAVDRASSLISTILIVIAAAITTALTLGAGASLWIPVLVTLGAGALGMLITAGMRGDRYTRSEMLRDAAMTIAQAATAGLGAAVGAGLRGGTGALRAVATSMKVSEAGLKAAAGPGGLRALTLLQELAIGAGGGAITGGVGAAVDPAARRGEGYVAGIFHGIFRGALGGAAGAGVVRGVTGGLTGLARNLGARSGASFVLARGGSLELAARVARMRAQAFSTSALTQIGVRTVAQGLSGVASTVSEIAYDRGIRDKPISNAQAWEMIADAFWLNAIQGMAEGAADYGARKVNRTAAMNHAYNMLEQQPMMEQAALKAVLEVGIRRGLLPPEAASPARPSAPPAAVATDEATPRPTVAVDEKGAVVPARRPDAEGDVPLRPLDADEGGRSRRAQDEEAMTAAVVRTADDDARAGRTIIIANDLPSTVHMRISLEQTDMVRMGRIGEDSILVHPDSRNVHAANDNFGRLILADPGREAAIFHNPVTGEYIVIQGDATRVGTIHPGGEFRGLNSTQSVSVNGVPTPGGHWVLRTHYHPNRQGEKGTRMARRIPSGADGDFAVIFREAKENGLDQHSSRIYFIDDGKVAYTDFGYNAKDPDARFWVDFPNPLTGNRTRHEFGTIAEYQTFLNRVTGIEFLASAGAQPGRIRTADVDQGGGVDPARRVGGEMADLGDRLTPRNIEDAAEVARHMARAAAFEDQIAGRAPRGDRDPLLYREASLNDAVAAVKRMGLVDAPDSTIRLGALLNDPNVSEAVKPLVARAVLEATQQAMRRDGRLLPGDELMMFFRGASAERLEDYRRGGVDPTMATAREEDLGPGLYMSQDYPSARNYGGEDTTVLPFIARRSELGNVLDIRPDSPLRGRWEKFVVDNWARLGVKPTTAAALGKPGPTDFKQFGFLWFPKAERVILYDAFRQSLLADPTVDPAIKRAAADPDIVLADLGGPVTYGNDLGFMTDQAAMKSRRVADLMNAQLGFPRVSGRPEEADMLRSGPARTADQPPDQKAAAAATTVQPSKPAVPDPQHLDRALSLAAARMEVNGTVWEDFARLMLGADQASAFAALTATNDADRAAALERFRQVLLPQLGPELAERRMRQLDYLASKGGGALRIEYEHSQRLAGVGGKLDALPAQMRGWAIESPVLLVFALKDAKRLTQLYDRYVAANNQAEALTSLEFERYVLTRGRKGDVALYDELRNLRADRPGEDRALDEMLNRQRRQGFTYRDPQEAPLLPEAGAEPARPIEKPEQLVKGLRIDHPQFGRGTIEQIEGEIVRIHFDSDPPDVERTIPHATDQLSRATDRDPRFGDPPPHRSQEEINQRIDEIFEFRSSALLPEFSQDAETGTVARIELGGEVFHGTSAGLDPPNYSLRNKRRQEIFERLTKEFGLKVPGDVSQNALFLGHAEAEAMLLAFDHFGRLPEVLEIFVDRSTCNDCRNNMVLLARMLGVKEVRVYYRNQTNPPLVRR